MKKTLLLFLSLIFPCLLFAQNEPENYKIASERFKQFYNANEADSIFSMFNPQMQSALSLEKTRTTVQQLNKQFGKLQQLNFNEIRQTTALYKATFDHGIFGLSLLLDQDNKIAGFYIQPYQEKIISTVDSVLNESPVTVHTQDATISGSLIIPKKTTGKVPVVLIIPGSGPTDRNGNGLNITAGTYFKLANALGKAGISTLRYDKRGVGQSTTTKAVADSRFEDMVNDATAMIQYLKKTALFSKIIVLGHSEGSLIGMLAAQKELLNGYISVSGAGENANVILARQLKNQPEDYYKTALPKIDSLSKGLKVNAALTDPLFSPAIQPYVISWMTYNPQTEIKKLKIPVLIVQGTTDLQVSVADAENLKKANPNATLKVIEGMNHVLKQAPADVQQNAATYVNADLPVDAQLIEAVTTFVKKLK